MSESDELLSACSTSAFRLECLSEYRVPEEASFGHVERVTASGSSLCQRWASGDRQFEIPAICDLRKGLATWFGRQPGRSFKRIRLVPNAFTEYLRFEIHKGYLPLQEVGAEFYMLDRSVFERVGGGSETCDYWLFDDALAVVQSYDSTGAFLSGDPTSDPDDLARLRGLADALLDTSVPLDLWLQTPAGAPYRNR